MKAGAREGFIPFKWIKWERVQLKEKENHWADNDRIILRNTRSSLSSSKAF